jgi:hypothetical protein
MRNIRNAYLKYRFSHSFYKIIRFVILSNITINALHSRIVLCNFTLERH